MEISCNFSSALSRRLNSSTIDRFSCGTSALIHTYTHSHIIFIKYGSSSRSCSLFCRACHSPLFRFDGLVHGRDLVGGQLVVPVALDELLDRFDRYLGAVLHHRVHPSWDVDRGEQRHRVVQAYELT